MKIFSKYIACLLAFVLILSCQEIIDLPLEQEKNRVVIEALIVDDAGASTVKLNNSLNYYDTTDLPAIKNATVSLLDQSGNQVEAFTYSEEEQLYRINNQYAAEANTFYTLQINIAGEIYEANGVIEDNARLDTLYYLSKEELQAMGKNVFGGNYFLFVDGKIQSDTIEFFQLKVMVNDTLKDSRGDIANSILSSRFFETTFDSLQLPGDFNGQDSVDIFLYTLTDEGFQYYNEFINLLFNDGGLFSPPPVNPTTNIVHVNKPEDYALGFVQFSSVLKRSIFIDEEYEE